MERSRAVLRPLRLLVSPAAWLRVALVRSSSSWRIESIKWWPGQWRARMRRRDLPRKERNLSNPSKTNDLHVGRKTLA